MTEIKTFLFVFLETLLLGKVFIVCFVSSRESRSIHIYICMDNTYIYICMDIGRYGYHGVELYFSFLLDVGMMIRNFD